MSQAPLSLLRCTSAVQNSSTHFATILKLTTLRGLIFAISQILGLFAKINLSNVTIYDFFKKKSSTCLEYVNGLWIQLREN